MHREAGGKGVRGWEVQPPPGAAPAGAGLPARAAPAAGGEESAVCLAPACQAARQRALVVRSPTGLGVGFDI